jgi:hypothetical protein
VAAAYITQQRVAAPQPVAQAAPTPATPAQRPVRAAPAAPPPPAGPTLATDRAARQDMQGLY